MAQPRRGAQKESEGTGTFVELGLVFFRRASAGIEALGVFPGQMMAFSRNVVDSHGLYLKVPHMG